MAYTDPAFEARRNQMLGVATPSGVGVPRPVTTGYGDPSFETRRVQILAKPTKAPEAVAPTPLVAPTQPTTFLAGIGKLPIIEKAGNFIDKLFKYPDVLIKKAQDFLAKPENIKIAEPLAEVQAKIIQPIFEKYPAAKGLVKGVSQTFLGSSEQVSEIFTRPLDTPVETVDKTFHTVGEITGSVLSYMAGGAVLKGLKFGKAMLPVLFTVLGQTSADTDTTVKQRIIKAPVDAVAGFFLSKVPVSRKLLSAKTLKGAGISASVLGGETFIDGLIEGLPAEEAAKSAAKMAVIGGLFHIAGTATGLFKEMLIKSKITTGEVIITPQEARNKVIGTNLENTKLGKFIIKTSFEAEAAGKSMKIVGEVTKRAAVAKALKLKTPEGIWVGVELVEPTLAIKPEKKALVPVKPEVKPPTPLPAKPVLPTPKPGVKVAKKPPVGEGREVVTKAAKYASASVFAKAEFDAKTTDQIGKMDATKIEPRDSVDEAGVEDYVKKIEAGKEVEPVEIVKKGEKFTTIEGSHRVTAYQRLDQDAVVIYRGKEKVEGLQTFEEVYKKAVEKPEEKKFDFKSTQLDLPKEQVSAITKFAEKVPDTELYTEEEGRTFGREKEPHITVLFGIGKSGISETKAIVEQYEPIEVEFGKMSIFETDKGYDVVKVDIKSPELKRLNKELDTKLDTPGKEFDVYKPHATIAYVKKGEGAKYIGDTSLKGQKITLSELSFMDRDGKPTAIKLLGRLVPTKPPVKPVPPKPKPIPKKVVRKVEKELAGEVEKRIGEISPPVGARVRRIYKPPITDKVEGLEFTNPEVETRFKQSKGINTSGYYQKKVREFIQNFYHRATRTYPDLPNKPRYAELRNILNKQKNLKPVVQDRAARILQGITADIGPNKLDLLTRKVILDDLVQEAKAGRPLPFGYSEVNQDGELIIKQDLLDADKEKIDKLVFANPDVAEALVRRKKIWKAITDELVSYDILKEKQVKKDYFRHQVLEYVNAKARATKGTGPALKKRKPSYARQRFGSTYDINTDYLEAEFEVMSQALHDIEIAKLLKEVEALPLNIKSKLMKQAKEAKIKDWHDLIPEGYVTWQPKDGRVFYQVNTIPDRIVNQFVDDIGTGILKIDKSLIGKALAIGGKRKELVLPEGMAKTLDNLWVAREPNWLRDSSRRMVTLWKKWVLFNPRRSIKYNYQNFLGDADAVIAGNPAIFKKFPQATNELYAIFKENAPMPDTMKDFFERGGFSSMLTIQEIPDLKTIRIFERFYENATRRKTILQKLNIFGGYWNKTIKWTQFRESQLRYAAYLDYIERFESGKNLNYGASNRKEVNALKNPKDQAAKVATELLGDYANITALGKDLRESIIPFYSWIEINLKRYPAILKNAWQEGAEKGAGSSARVAGLGVIKGAWAIYKVLLRMIGLTGAVMLYNQLFHSDAEQDLSNYDRGRMHINLGYNKNGEVVILRGQGAFSDALEWFGLDEVPILWGEYLDGKASLVDIFGKIPLITGKIGLRPVVQKFLGSISPTYKAPLEFISGYTWPYQGTESYPIRDKWRKMFQNVQLENEYDWIFQKPSRGYLKSWERAIITVTDPQENAYRYIQAEKYKFLATKGKGGTGSYYTERTIVYRNYKKALAYGDKVAEDRAWEEMRKLGVKMEDLEKSLVAADPLYGLNKAEEAEFIDVYLSTADRVRLKKADDYYKKVFLGR